MMMNPMTLGEFLLFGLECFVFGIVIGRSTMKTGDEHE